MRTFRVNQKGKEPTIVKADHWIKGHTNDSVIFEIYSPKSITGLITSTTFTEGVLSVEELFEEEKESA